MDMVEKIMEQLVSLYPDCEIYSETAEQGFAGGSFYVLQLTGASKAYPAGRQRRLQTFEVQYFSKTERPCAECRRIAEELALDLQIVGGIRATGMEWSIADGVLHFSVSYNTFMRAPQVSEERMTELSVQTATGG